MATIQNTTNFPPDPQGAAAPQQRRGNPPARRAGIPVPPAQPANDPNMLQTDVPSDPLSPTTLVLNYLKSRGYQPTAENVRRAVEANMRDPGVLGADPISGLRNTQIEDSAPASSRSTRGGGGGGLVQEGGSWDVGSSAKPTSGTGDGTARPTGSGVGIGLPSWSMPPDPTNSLTTTADAAMRYALSDAQGRSIVPPPPPGPVGPGAATAATTDFTRPPPPPMPGVPVDTPAATVTSRAGSVPPAPGLDTALTTATDGAPVRPIGPPGGLNTTPPQGPISVVPPQRITPQTLAGGQGQQNQPQAEPAPAPPLPTSTPEGTGEPPRTSTTLRGNPSSRPPPTLPQPPGPRIAPGPRVGGAPIIASPWQKAIPKVVGGVLTRNPTAVAGGLAAAAPDIVPYIMKNMPWK